MIMGCLFTSHFYFVIHVLSMSKAFYKMLSYTYFFFFNNGNFTPKKTLFHICNRSIAKDHIFLFTLTHLAKSSGREPTFFIKVAESPPSTYSITIHRCFWNIHSYHSHSLDICMRHSTLLSINFLPIFILNHSNSYF